MRQRIAELRLYLSSRSFSRFAKSDRLGVALFFTVLRSRYNFDCFSPTSVPSYTRSSSSGFRASSSSSAKMLTRVAQNITDTAKKRRLVRGVTAGDNFILKELSLLETENNLLSILHKKVLRWSQYRARMVEKFGREIFRAFDVTSKVIQACNRLKYARTIGKQSPILPVQSH